MLDIIQQLVGSSLWEKLLLDFLIFFFIRSLLKRDKEASIRELGLIPIILVTRDIAFHLFYLPQIIIISDIFLMITYFYWLRKTSGKTKINFYFYSIPFIIIIFIILNSIFSFLPEFLHRIMLVSYILYFIVEIYKISEYNTENATLLIDTRGVISFALISYNILMFFIGDNNEFAYSFIVMLSYTIHLYVLNKYNTMQHLEDKKIINGFEHELNSLFNFMRVIGTSIGEKLELATMLDHICTSAKNNINADGSSILLIDDVDNVLVVEAVSGIFPPPYPIPDAVKTKIDNIVEYFKSTSIAIGESILGEVIKTGKAIFIRDTKNDERMIQNTKNDLLYITSIMVVPLKVSNRILGVIALCRRTDNRFSRRDFDNISTFSGLASLSLNSILTYIELLEKKEMEREVGIAADIQQQLLPSKLPDIKNTAISAFTLPAKGVSGDYYDIIPLKKGKIALVMCDVAGKGIPASLVMIMIRTVIQLIASANKDASTIVSWINRGITGKIEIDHYATLSFLTYDPEDGAIEYCNAGHHPLLIYRKEYKSFEIIDTPGLPIGIEAKTEYIHTNTHLLSGDSIYLYTDGIIEAMDSKGNQYSYESMIEFISKNPDLNPAEMAGGIRNEITNFVGKARQHDDQTLLIMSVK